MHHAGATATYSVPALFDEAVASVHTALADAGLAPVPVLDASRLMSERLGVLTHGCKVFAVSPDLTPSEQTLAAVMPLHVAVSAHGRTAQVHILGQAGGQDSSPLFARVHGALTEALSRISMRRPQASVL